MSHSVSVSDWRPIKKGALLASCTLTLPSGLILRECGIFKKDGRRWVSGPARSFAGKDGKVAYQQLLSFASRATQDDFNTKALDAVDEFLGVAQ